MNYRVLLIRSLFITLIAIQVIIGNGYATETSGTGEYLLSSISTSLDHSLEQIDQNLTGIAGAFGISDMGNISASDIISPYQMNQEGLEGFILFDGDTIYPLLNSSSIKTPFDPSLLQDSAINNSIRYIKPKLSQEKEMFDSKRVVMISRPAVVNDRIGAAIALLIPWSFCDALIQPRINGTHSLCVIMQLDGTILYSSDTDELTKIPPENFLTEFPTFRDVKTAMISQKGGSLRYELWRADRSEPKSRTAYWDTINLHGTEWRVMVAEPE